MEDPAAKRARVGGLEPSPTEAEILHLVSQREAHRQRQQFAESDIIRQQLRDLGVELYDKDRQWKCKDGRSGVLFTAGPYESSLTNEEIQAKIEEREEARRAKEWEKSNFLRDELRACGVELCDKESTWRTLAGRAGSYQGCRRAPTLSGAQIHSLVVERERKRESKEYEAADRIRAQLAQHGVEIFDAERMWKTTDGQQGVILTGGHEVHCILSEAEINQRVAQREDARNSKQWTDADLIRDELRRLGVEVLDNQRIWCTTDGRQGPYPGQPATHPATPSLVQTTLSAHANRSSLAANTAPVGVVQGGDMTSQAIAGLAMLAQKGQVPAHLSAQVASVLSNHAAPAASAHAPAAGQPVVHPGVFQTVAGAPPFEDATIVALIAARESARERHDWQAADSIRNDLRKHGIEVWDKEKVWKAQDGRHGTIQSSANGALSGAGAAPPQGAGGLNVNALISSLGLGGGGGGFSGF